MGFCRRDGNCVCVCVLLIAGEMMISRARSYGNRDHQKQAHDLRVPSCEDLKKIGIDKYMPY